jgi:hypothetical protein
VFRRNLGRKIGEQSKKEAEEDRENKCTVRFSGEKKLEHEELRCGGGALVVEDFFSFSQDQ